MQPADAPLVASAPLDSCTKKQPAVTEEKPPPPAKYLSAYDDKLKERAKREPIAKTRQLTIQERFEGIVELLRRTGLSLGITVTMTEESAKQTMPYRFDLRHEDPMQLLYDLKDLEMGDVLTLALVNDWLYYFPRSSPNIYEDPVKREEHAKLREENEKAALAFAKKHKANLPLRIGALETKMVRMGNYEANLERADRAIRELLKQTKAEENDRDLVIALREEVKDTRETIQKVPVLITRADDAVERIAKLEERLDTISRRVDAILDRLGQVQIG
jgi:hypothetical protein